MYIEVFDIAPLVTFFDMIFKDAEVVELKIRMDKISITLLNKGRIAFYGLEISKDFFDDYQVDEPENLMVFVEDFYKILKSATKDDVLYLESNDSFLICKFEHDNNRRVFELPLAETYNEVPNAPSLDYMGVFDVLLDDLKIPADDLDRIVKTNKFKIVTADSVMNIIAPSDAMTKYSQTVNIDNDCRCTVIVDNNYIKQIIRLSKINKVVTLKLGDNMPLSWEIKSPDELVTVNGLIAPIIEDDL